MKAASARLPQTQVYLIFSTRGGSQIPSTGLEIKRRLLRLLLLFGGSGENWAFNHNCQPDWQGRLMVIACEIPFGSASPAINEVDVDSLYLSGSVLFFNEWEQKGEGVRVRSQRVTETERRERRKVETEIRRARGDSSQLDSSDFCSVCGAEAECGRSNHGISEGHY